MTEQQIASNSAMAGEPSFRKGVGALRGALTLKAFSAGTVAAIFGCTGPALIIISAADAGHLTGGQTVAWLMSVYILGAMISLIMALRYRQPITGAYSIPGAAILVGALGTVNFNEAVGAFIMSGVVILLLGLSGVIGRIMRWLPMPIVMAMIAGALIRFGTGAVDAVSNAPAVAGSAVVAYLLAARLLRSVPPVLAALVVGLVASLAFGMLQPADVPLAFTGPELTAPSFTLNGFLAISLPLSLLIIGAENAQATGVLMAEGYRPPVNAMTIISGIGGILAGIFGGHNANIAGPMTAICSSEEAGDDKEKRFGATIVNGVLFGVFGLVAGAAVPFVLALPKPLIMVVGGLAMISVLLLAFQQAFSRQLGHQTGAFVALVVAMSNMTLFGISAPFWALVFGVLVSLILERSPGPHAEARPRATTGTH